jgi:hypothetical protein
MSTVKYINIKKYVGKETKLKFHKVVAVPTLLHEVKFGLGRTSYYNWAAEIAFSRSVVAD